VLAFGTEAGQLGVFEVDQGSNQPFSASGSHSSPVKRVCFWECASAAPRSVAASSSTQPHSGLHLVSLCESGAIYCWNVDALGESPRSLRDLLCAVPELTSAAVSSSTTTPFGSSSSVTATQERTTLASAYSCVHSSAVGGVCARSLLGVGTKDGRVEVHSGSAHLLVEHRVDCVISAVAFSQWLPDNDACLLGVGDENGQVRVWRIAVGESAPLRGWLRP
jgi:hypothetical protein